MFDKMKQKLYFVKAQLLLENGISKDDIVPFEDELYDRLSRIYFTGLPISINLKYLKPMLPPGKCYDRSYLITMGFENSTLVRGDNKDLEINYGKGNAGHGWVENNGFVYDPTLLLRFKKELYYEIYKPSNLLYIKASEYKKTEWYQETVNTTIDDFKIGGKKRMSLCASIPLVQGIAEMSKREDFSLELNEYLDEIGYNYEEISEELNKAINKQYYLKK